MRGGRAGRVVLAWLGALGIAGCSDLDSRGPWLPVGPGQGMSPDLPELEELPPVEFEAAEAGGEIDLDGVPNAQQAPAPAEQFIRDVRVGVHPGVRTVLVVEWTQSEATGDVWLEFAFEDENVMTSRRADGSVGPHRDVVLGAPGETAVTFRIVADRDGEESGTREYSALTGAVPRGMPAPQVLEYDAELASPDRWLFGSVEDSNGGCDNPACYYHTTFWLYIMDRKGRVVWYYADPASNATSSFQRVARDGEYIWIEKRPFGLDGGRGVLKMTLDWQYMEQIDVAGLADAIDVTSDGSLLYNLDDPGSRADLRELTRDGDVRSIWSCRETFRDFNCYSNTINWNERDDTVLMSFPYQNTAVEIDRQSGDLVGIYGEAINGYSFSPDTWEFQFQHFPNITPDGTLLVSSHMPGFSDTNVAVEFEHAFMEFEIDRESRSLIERWVYNDGPEWAMYKGMAIRLPNGNTLANYGTGGVIREITPDKQTAFLVKFDAPRGSDFFNKMVGHNVLIDDLYALNGGPR